jgi:hypothetical protein
MNSREDIKFGHQAVKDERGKTRHLTNETYIYDILEMFEWNASHKMLHWIYPLSFSIDFFHRVFATSW